MDDGVCDLLRCCCECGLCIGLCCLCCKSNDSTRHQDPYYANGPTVTVTTQPIPQQPYPVHGGPPPGVHPNTSPYAPNTSPYPPAMPMPQHQQGYPSYPSPHYQSTGPAYPPGPAPGASPYPPTGYAPQPGFQNHPPPYDVAMAMPPAHPAPPQTEAYGKQAAYNPHYQS